jgi:hypothetical protein
MSDNHDWWQGRSNQSWQDDEWSNHYSDQRWFSSDWSQGHWDVESSWNHTPYFSRRSSWTTWSAPHSEHDWQERADSGRWWNTPKGRFWGDTLDEAVEWAVKQGWITTDKAFCQWWSSQNEAIPESLDEGTEEPIPDLEPINASGEGDRPSSSVGSSEKVRYGKDSIPEFDGSTTMREYRRRVKLFESVTSISPQYRAGRLLERLSGLAWKAAETLDLESIKTENGVSVLLAHLDQELEPLEYMKTFQVLSHFFDHFKRQRGEQMSSYDTSFRIQCDKLREVGSPLEGTAQAWWFLQKAGISDDTRQKVVSAAGGVYDYLKLRQALVAIIPDVHKHADASKSADSSMNGPGPRKWQNAKKFHVAHRVNAVAEAGEDDGDEGGLEDGELSEAGQLEVEAEILMTHAARKRAEAEKGRGFSQSSKSRETPEERARRIEALKQKLPCSACKAAGVLAYGHWHSDEACPQRKGKPNETFVTSNLQNTSDSDGDSLEDAFAVKLTGTVDQKDLQVLMQTASLRKESQLLALSDTCCARSVAGEKWMIAHLTRLHHQQIPFWCHREHEPFRFGAGPRTYSKWAVVSPWSLSTSRRTSAAQRCGSVAVWFLMTCHFF